jgi:hypothetical protein
MKEDRPGAETLWHRFTHSRVANVIAGLFLLAIVANVVLTNGLRAASTPPGKGPQPAPATPSPPADQVANSVDDDPSPVDTPPWAEPSRRERFKEEWAGWSEAKRAEICWSFNNGSVEGLNELREDHHAIFSVLLVECGGG